MVGARKSCAERLTDFEYAKAASARLYDGSLLCADGGEFLGWELCERRWPAEGRAIERDDRVMVGRWTTPVPNRAESCPTNPFPTSECSADIGSATVRAGKWLTM